MSDSARLYAYKALFENKLRYASRHDGSGRGVAGPLSAISPSCATRWVCPSCSTRTVAGITSTGTTCIETPGLWFSPEELVALLTIQRLIEQLQPGLVGLKLNPLKKKLTDLLQAKGLGEAEIANRVRMTSAGKRECS